MSPWKRRARRDANERELVKVIRQCGAQWIPVNMTDGPDGFISHRGRVLAVEVKTEKGKLKPGQAAFHAAWQGGRIYVVRTIDDVLALLT